MPTHSALSNAFMPKHPNPRLPSLTPNTVVPNELKSALASSRRGLVGMGIVSAIVKLLAREANVTIFNAANARAELGVVYSDSRHSGKTAVCRDMANAHGREWIIPQGCDKGAYLLALTESLLLGHAREIRERFDAMVAHVSSNLQIAFPTNNDSHWRELDADQTFKQHVIGLADALYFNAKTMIDSGTVQVADAAADLHAAGRVVSPVDLRMQRLTRAAAPAPSSGADTTPLARLKRLAAQGGTALMTGPTGTFKTHTGKRLAIETNARLVSLKGAAGLEDRDFWGAITPTPNGPAWVDGPLTRAFRLAREHKTVLLIDELLRFEPLYANVLVGALDTVSSDELTAMGQQPLDSDAVHYCVTLPSGETIATLKRNLTIIATTNVGEDYAQFGELDAALLGRFEVQIEMPEADPSVLKSIYSGIIKHAKLISALLKFERWTRENTGAHGGLLQRPSNPRVSMNLLHETARLHADGVALRAALEAAFDVTLLPYCTPRTSDGALAEDAASVLADEFRTVLRSVS